MTDVLLVLTTLPDEATAQHVARSLVEAGHAACVSIGAPVRSIYTWQGAIEEAAEVAGATARQRVEIVMADDCPAFMIADPGLFRIALSNLIDNALKYAPEGKVVVTLSSGESYLKIHVIDAGPGIPEAEHDSVFQRYQRGSSAPKDKGAGLGLAVSRHIAHAHGGDLRLLQSTAAGSTFELALPILSEKLSR